MVSTAKDQPRRRHTGQRVQVGQSSQRRDAGVSVSVQIEVGQAGQARQWAGVREGLIPTQVKCRQVGQPAQKRNIRQLATAECKGVEL